MITQKEIKFTKLDNPVKIEPSLIAGEGLYFGEYSGISPLLMADLVKKSKSFQYIRFEDEWVGHCTGSYEQYMTQVKGIRFVFEGNFRVGNYFVLLALQNKNLRGHCKFDITNQFNYESCSKTPYYRYNEESKVLLFELHSFLYDNLNKQQKKEEVEREQKRYHSSLIHIHTPIRYIWFIFLCRQ